MITMYRSTDEGRAVNQALINENKRATRYRWLRTWVADKNPSSLLWIKGQGSVASPAVAHRNMFNGKNEKEKKKRIGKKRSR